MQELPFRRVTMAAVGLDLKEWACLNEVTGSMKEKTQDMYKIFDQTITEEPKVRKKDSEPLKFPTSLYG